MSTVQVHYAVYGIKVPYPKHWNQAKWAQIEDYRDDAVGTFSVIVDGMGSEYMVIGKVLAVGDQFDGIDMTDCGMSMAEHCAISKQIADIFPEYVDIWVSMWVFTHWT